MLMLAVFAINVDHASDTLTKISALGMSAWNDIECVFFAFLPGVV